MAFGVSLSIGLGSDRQEECACHEVIWTTGNGHGSNRYFRFPPVAGDRGAAIALLEDAGVEVLFLDQSALFEEQNAAFCAWMSPSRERAPKPWVIAKWAQTRTGQLSPPEDVGEGRWISGEESQLEVQGLRARVDAILSGAGTVKADDPRLTLRGSAVGVAPKRVVLDSYLRTSPKARLFQEPDDGESGGAVIILVSSLWYKAIMVFVVYHSRSCVCTFGTSVFFSRCAPRISRC